jgi:nitroimidazol reductase NimA-like FMN-containing flavoprotein (pyridoxamine 5'-phosphate oxidase superfamily)
MMTSEGIGKATPYIITTGQEAREKIETTLRSMEVGRLGLCDGDQPYVLPMNYLYTPGRLIFHGPLSGGKKIGIIQKNPKACFVVDRPMEVMEPGAHTCHVEYESLICYGTVREVTKVDERAEFFHKWNDYYKYDHGTWSMEEAAKTCGILIFDIKEVTMRPGKFLAKGPRPLYVYEFKSM